MKLLEANPCELYGFLVEFPNGARCWVTLPALRRLYGLAS